MSSRVMYGRQEEGRVNHQVPVHQHFLGFLDAFWYCQGRDCRDFREAYVLSRGFNHD